ncbi:MAG: hypothetical protein IKL57_03765 [Oscillospiraceae bacterium]|nr:hypothetical protein [Oscillospiraceae bacterium]
MALVFSVAKEATINTPFRTKKTAPHFYAIGILHEKPLTIKSGVPCIRTNASSKAPSALSFRAKGQSREFGQTFFVHNYIFGKKRRFLSGKDPFGEEKRAVSLKRAKNTPFNTVMIILIIILLYSEQ